MGVNFLIMWAVIDPIIRAVITETSPASGVLLFDDLPFNDF